MRQGFPLPRLGASRPFLTLTLFSIEASIHLDL
jgi:hypothetical protein